MTETKALIADWILPVATAPIKNGAVVFDRDQIIYVGPESLMPPCDSVTRHRRTAILPGLINAHTHLEFSNLEKPLGRPGIDFTKWIAEVVAWRISDGADKRNAIKKGIDLSVAAGVAAIGEIASPPVDPDHYVDRDAVTKECLIQIFQEALGSDKSNYDQTIDQLKNTAEALFTAGLTPAISPHAPYSVPQILLDRLVDLTNPAGHCLDRPPEVSEHLNVVAMHIAETIAEREFVEHRRGPFIEMLKQFGVWRPEMFSENDSILNILRSLAKAPRSLVIHGNYLAVAELDFIATVKDRMSIVFCPRTHRYFHHADYPMAAILERGINLAIGTDSLASNPDLNLLNELKQIRQSFPQLPESKILEMGTTHGAIALGIDNQLGTLQPGKAGQFCNVELADANDPYSWLNS